MKLYFTVVMAMLVVVQVVVADGWKRSAQDVSCTAASPALLYSGGCSLSQRSCCGLQTWRVFS